VTGARAPATLARLEARAADLAGHTLGELAAALGRPVPADLRRDKGWVGQLLEAALGAAAGAQAEPDFPHLGVELKTLPVDARGRPRESTYVCTVPLGAEAHLPWARSWVRRKLACVLWVPVEAAAGVPLARRRVGTPLLWRPAPAEDAALRADYEELMELVCRGELERIDARRGRWLQIRPKAAHGRVLTAAVGADGETISTLPRGFYLRAGFTAALLARHYQLPVT